MTPPRPRCPRCSRGWRGSVTSSVSDVSSRAHGGGAAASIDGALLGRHITGATTNPALYQCCGARGRPAGGGGVGRDVSVAPRRASQKNTHMQMICAHIVALLSVGTKGRLMRVGGIPERALRSARGRLLAAPSLLLLLPLLLHEVDTETCQL